MRGRFRLLLPAPPVVCAEPDDVAIDRCLPELRYSFLQTHQQATRRGKILAKITREKLKQKPPVDPAVSAAARELGRKGGLKGGKARAAKLSAERRSEIARVAAYVRHHGKGKKRKGKRK